MKETKSNWACVAQKMCNQHTINLGRYAAYWMRSSPRRMLHSMSYYKFAAKMIGKNKRVLDVGCNEGLGTYLLAKECGYAQGVDFDTQALQTAEHNFQVEHCDFTYVNFLESQQKFHVDAVVSFDMIEHILPEHEELLLTQIKNALPQHGICIIGTPSMISQQFASTVSKQGHVNIYTPERLEATMRKHFEYVFIFAANDEVVHTGYFPLAHYLIVMGCTKK